MELARLVALALGVALPSLVVATPAFAGCGCDHPPPGWAVVMPPFASPGVSITIYAEGGDTFTPGAVYQVDFGHGDQVDVTATASDWLEVANPGARPGPVALRVRGPGYDHDYAESAFTALPPAETMPNHGIVRLRRDRPTAVSADGTLLIPVDLEAVLDPMQFAFSVRNLPLHFEAEDVVIYNADGVDLTLFTLDVADPTERQWGSYYGWSVENDTGLAGLVYNHRVRRALNLGVQSDVFTYWRHEFHSYAEAHDTGGSHEVDANGHHPDGTLHIDHGQIVIAIQARVRPDLSPLEPGGHELDIAFASFVTENPIEPPAVQDEVEEILTVIETALP